MDEGAEGAHRDVQGVAHDHQQDEGDPEVPAVSVAEHHLAHVVEGHAQHDGSIEPHVLHIASIDALVDERCRHPWNQHVHHHLQRREHRRHHRRPLVLSYLSIKSL